MRKVERSMSGMRQQDESALKALCKDIRNPVKVNR